MIQIRSITYNLPSLVTNDHFTLIKKSTLLWDKFDVFIRTKRLSFVPFDEPVSLDYFKNVDRLCNDCGIRWFNVPINPWNTKSLNKLYEFGYEILKNFDQSFVNINTVFNGKVDCEILNKSVKLIKRVGKMSNNGKDNFRLGISSNISYDCPFFPFSMSSGDFSFSIALELTQEINKIILENKKINLVALRDKIITSISSQIKYIFDYAITVEKESGIKFAGFDFSLAPIIDENGSVITILNHIGVNSFGETGTIFATAYLTDILKKFADMYPSVGFSGVMYSLLEDLELCKINNDKGVSLDNLIKLSTMCGCGIDMVPVTEETTDEQLEVAILDVMAISTRLHKPLGIRFLPIPKSKNGEISYTTFNEDADFISNTRVLELSSNTILNNNIRSFDFLVYKV